MLMDHMKQLNLMPILTVTTITIVLTRSHLASERCCISNDLKTRTRKDKCMIIMDEWMIMVYDDDNGLMYDRKE